MTPGIKTTEFWITVLVVLASAAVGIVAVICGHSLIDKGITAFSMLVAYLKARGYTLGRVRQKLESVLLPTAPPAAPTPLPPASPASPAPTPVTVPIIPELTVTTKVNKAGDTVITTSMKAPA